MMDKVVKRLTYMLILQRFREVYMVYPRVTLGIHTNLQLDTRFEKFENAP